MLTLVLLGGLGCATACVDGLVGVVSMGLDAGRATGHLRGRQGGVSKCRRGWGDRKVKGRVGRRSDGGVAFFWRGTSGRSGRFLFFQKSYFQGIFVNFEKWGARLGDRRVAQLGGGFTACLGRSGGAGQTLIGSELLVFE